MNASKFLILFFGSVWQTLKVLWWQGIHDCIDTVQILVRGLRGYAGSSYHLLCSPNVNFLLFVLHQLGFACQFFFGWGRAARSQFSNFAALWDEADYQELVKMRSHPASMPLHHLKAKTLRTLGSLEGLVGASRWRKDEAIAQLRKFYQSR